MSQYGLAAAVGKGVPLALAHQISVDLQQMANCLVGVDLHAQFLGNLGVDRKVGTALRAWSLILADNDDAGALLRCGDTAGKSRSAATNDNDVRLDGLRSLFVGVSNARRGGGSRKGSCGDEGATRDSHVHGSTFLSVLVYVPARLSRATPQKRARRDIAPWTMTKTMRLRIDERHRIYPGNVSMQSIY